MTMIVESPPMTSSKDYELFIIGLQLLEELKTETDTFIIWRK